MGAASKGGIICGKCGQSRRKFQEMKGAIPVCKQCFQNTVDAENAELRREIHELKAQMSRMKRDGFIEELRIVKRIITPPEQRWDGY